VFSTIETEITFGRLSSAIICRRADFVNHVNRFVGQMPVVDVFSGEFRSDFQRFVRIFDAVMLFVKSFFKPFKIS
jgi:predicted aconitase with swiveling domain